MTEAIKPYAAWRPRLGENIRVSVLHGFNERSFSILGAVLAHTIRFVINDPNYERYFSPLEIDRLFNEEVLAQYGEGRYFDPSMQLRKKLDTLNKWGDLISNHCPVFYDIAFLADYLEGDLSICLTLDEIGILLDNINKGLRKLKIIEEWMYNNPAFMLGIVASRKRDNAKLKTSA